MHRRVLRHALPHLPDAEVVGRKLRDLTAAAEDRRRVAALLRLPHGAVHELLHVREAREIVVEDLAGFLGRDAESLAESVGLHPVRETEVDNLCEAALEGIGLPHEIVQTSIVTRNDRVRLIEPSTV